MLVEVLDTRFIAGSPSPAPGPSMLLALLGGTFCSVAFHEGSFAGVILSAAVGAAVSYATGFLLKRIFEPKRKG